jgi:hypothetical protein
MEAICWTDGESRCEQGLSEVIGGLSKNFDSLPNSVRSVGVTG